MTHGRSAPRPSIEELGEFLDLAVPLISADLAWRIRHDFPHNPETAQRWLRGIVRRGGTGLGHGGDTLQFQHNAHQNRVLAAVTAQRLAEGVAALALLEADAGVTVLGRHFCPLRPCPHDHRPDPAVFTAVNNADAPTVPRTRTAADRLEC